MASNVRECEVADRFLDHPTEDSFSELFRVFSPQLVAFFRNRGQEAAIAEDLAQEVMLKVYQKAWQIRDRRLFRAWLFKIARRAVGHYLTKLTREVPTVNLANVDDKFAVSPHTGVGCVAFEFREWMSLLDPRDQDLMLLRFVEEWEYHEIASSQAVPIGTVQWRVFNLKKRLRCILNRWPDLTREGTLGPGTESASAYTKLPGRLRKVDIASYAIASTRTVREGI
jgi:RNA polymerase sigma-70 factor (ECF subfamily)